jgi:hypothetical protein
MANDTMVEYYHIPKTCIDYDPTAPGKGWGTCVICCCCCCIKPIFSSLWSTNINNSPSLYSRRKQGRVLIINSDKLI